MATSTVFLAFVNPLVEIVVRVGNAAADALLRALTVVDNPYQSLHP